MSGTQTAETQGTPQPPGQSKQQQHEHGTASVDRTPPPPPNPSSDPRLCQVARARGADTAGSDDDDDDHDRDIFKLPAAEALRLLSTSVELLVRMTGDVPPTPPPKISTNPQMSGMQAEKESIKRSHSDLQLAARQQQEMLQHAEAERKRREVAHASGTAPSAPQDKAGVNDKQSYNAAMAAQLMAQQKNISTSPPSGAAIAASVTSADPTAQPIDGVRLRHGDDSLTAMSPPTTNHNEPPPYIVVGDDSQPVNLQHGAITRKFYSKKEPPITISQYLMRLHQFCPMSTAVYLATSLYIHRLAVDERAIPVTRRNAHRLVLAGLRVAMKALEDLSYPHSKMARVGGVSETELARLEISFCFLAGFDLVVGEEPLRRHWEALRRGKTEQALGGMGGLTLKLGRRPRETSREVSAED